jgi:hypothetical protein
VLYPLSYGRALDDSAEFRVKTEERLLRDNGYKSAYFLNSAHSTWNSALAVATAVAVIQVSGLAGQGIVAILG